MKRFLSIVCLTLFSSCSSKHVTIQEVPFTVENDSDQSISESQVFFLLQSARLEDAITALQEARTNNPYLYHSKILESLGLQILSGGIKANNVNDSRLSLYGIGISLNEDALALTKGSITSSEPELQLAAIEVLRMYNTDEANTLLQEGLKSDYLLIRLEAAQALAMKKHASAYSQIEALFLKVDPECRSFFPELFAEVACPESIQMLKRLLRDHDPEVRLATVCALRQLKMDDFIPELKNQVNDSSPALQEAACASLGDFRDHSTKAILEKMMLQGSIFPRLTAAFELYEMGDERGRDIIEEEAKKDNLYAISLLGKMNIGTPLLIEKMHSSDPQVRLNATIALLDQKKAQALEGLFDIFIQRANDLAFQTIPSPGKALISYKAIPSALENLKNTPFLFEVSLRLREELLVKTLELPEDDFLEVAHMILACQQHDLIPLLVRLLENQRSDAGIRLLKEQSERLGSPFIRAYCNLTLFRLNEPGSYANQVLEWVKKNETHNLIEMRPILPWQIWAEKSPYSLTLEEQSRLLVESFETLALSHREEAISALLDAIKNGNEHNRYLLAGLLIRAAQ